MSNIYEVKERRIAKCQKNPLLKRLTSAIPSCTNKDVNRKARAIAILIFISALNLVTEIIGKDDEAVKMAMAEGYI